MCFAVFQYRCSVGKNISCSGGIIIIVCGKECGQEKILEDDDHENYQLCRKVGDVVILFGEGEVLGDVCW